MSTLEQLDMRTAGQGRQIALLWDEVRRLRRETGGDVLVLEEWCRQKDVTLAEAMGPRRPEAIRALRDSLPTRRVAKVFGVSRRTVQMIANAKMTNGAEAKP